MSKEQLEEHTHIAVKIDEYKKLKEQNKRYREAIENVLEIENYGVATDYIKTVTNILNKALEDENE